MRNKIKILECIRQGQIGGGESHLLSLLENIDKSKFSPFVLSFSDGPMVDRLKAMNIPVFIIPTKTPFDFRTWSKVKKIINENEIDLVHAHGTRANSNVISSARSLKIPVIYTVHGWSFHKGQKKITQRIRIFGESYLTRRSDINISVSASNQATGKKYIPSFQSIVVNNGIDMKKFNMDTSYKDVRAELNISSSATLLLFIARFTFQKQPIKLIEAFKEASRSNSNLHLLMVGEGEQRGQAEKLIKDAGLDNKITLLPFRSDVPDILSAADIFVLPSLWEGLPIGLLEAMAMGKATIATNVDGTSEIIQNGINGLLLDPEHTPAELAKAILNLSGDGMLRKELSLAAYNTIRDKFDVVQMTQQIEDIYLRVRIEKKKL